MKKQWFKIIWEYDEKTYKTSHEMLNSDYKVNCEKEQLINQLYEMGISDEGFKEVLLTTASCLMGIIPKGVEKVENL